jgi:flagella basal body P-ring formation protein FlgA
VEYAPGRKVPVWARVHVTVPVQRVVANRTIPAGQRIEESDLRLETELAVPGATEKAFASMQDIAGRNARRTITAESSIAERDVVKAPVVARGDVIRVDVHAGRALISFEGVAQASANVGELIPVKNMETRKVMRARVASRGNAVITLDR